MIPFIVIAVLTAFGIDSPIRWDYRPEPLIWVQVEAEPSPPLEACLTVTYDWPWGSPIETGREYVNLEGWEIRADIVGFYLWVQFDTERVDSDSVVGVSSIPLAAGTDQIEVCRSALGLTDD